MMTGVESPISGLIITKKILIDYRGLVTVSAIAENITDKSVSWDLWMNTRLDGFARCYVPVDSNSVIELVKKGSDYLETTPFVIEDELFTFIPSVPVDGRRVQVQEVHLQPRDDYLVGFSSKQALRINFTRLERNKVHKNHGLVEIYNTVNYDGSSSLLELEVHGEYKTISPGETISLTETWEVLTYNGEGTRDGHINFLSNLK